MKNKVSLLRCDGYDLDLVKESIKQSITNLGGLDLYINPGERVLLKVNLLMKKRPEEGTTTHPAFVYALASLLIENGNEVLIGDSPGGPFDAKILKDMYKVAGFEAVANSTGATLNYNVGSFEAENPKGLLLKRILVTDMLNDVDKVISVSKLKTHGMMTFTGAVKNMFGIIPGVTKAEYHLNMPKYDDFSNALIDICLCANPVLSFMDGIVGMEGDGPSSGELRNIGAVIASDSPFHLDKVACGVIGLDIMSVPILANSIKRGLCQGDLSDVELIGENPESFNVKDYKIPEAKLLSPVSGMPRFIQAPVNRFLQPRPIFDKDLCVACGVCLENCPAKIIVIKNKYPKADLRKCIRCYCCQELCPTKAVTIHKTRVLETIASKYMKLRK